MSPLDPHQVGLFLILRAAMANLLRNALGLREQQQVIRSAGLGVGAAHIEAAEGVSPDHRARALAVQIEVADVELCLRAIELLARVRVDGSRQTILGIVGDLKGFVEAAAT